MKTYLISYDLYKTGQNYELLIENIKKLSPNNWCHPLESLWVIKSNFESIQIRNDLRNFIDENDLILVAQITENTAWYLWETDSECLKRKIFYRN